MIKIIIAINDHGQSFCFKQTQLVAYKSDTTCKDIQRESISLFSIWRLQGSPVFSVPMALNPKSFQKCYSYEDNTNLFWAQIFLVEHLETSPYEF